MMRVLGPLLCVLAVAVGLAALAAYGGLFGTSRTTTKAVKQATTDKYAWLASMRLGVSCQLARSNAGTAPEGSPLAQVLSEASLIGLDVQECPAHWDTLTRHDGLTVALLEGEPVVLDFREGFDKPDKHGMARVYHSDGPAVWASRESLETQLTGQALLLSAPARTPTTNPRLTLGSCYEDAGLLDTNSAAEYSVGVVNTGGQPLTVKVTGTSCGCTTAVVDDQVLDPAQKTTLKCVVDTSNKHGLFSEQVVLQTNDPARPQVTVVLCGAVPRAERLSNSYLQLGGLLPGSTTRQAVAVYDRGDGRLRLGEVRTWLSKPVAASAHQPLCSVSVLRPGDVSEEQRDRHKVGWADKMLQFVISVPPQSPTGEFRFTGSVDLGEGALVPFVVAGTVLPDLAVAPVSLVLDRSRLPPGPMSVRLSLTRRSGSPVGKIRVGHNAGIRVVDTKQETLPDQSVVLNLAVEAADGGVPSVEGLLSLATEHCGTVDVPVLIVRGGR